MHFYDNAKSTETSVISC